MVKVVFVRHGQTEWNVSGRYQGQSDVALSAAGIEQAEKLAANFPVEHIDAVYSSDLIRARVTAETVAKRFGLSVQLEPAFRELSFGDWEGLTYEQIVASWPDAMENFLAHPDILNIPNGESFPEVQQRAMSRLQELLREHEGQTIMIAAHGAVLRTMLTAALHMPLQYLWSIRQFNTAVNIVRYDAEGNPTVELLNSTAHLGELR
ncbi:MULTISPECIES: histidine phosphatase family protein [Selenomonas]|uniref:Histidine phosphatase family protein n=1 Tax=Selenomonas ruminis TaxID=2593411 RepID=A0A5D6W3T8_9FIRM|nr:MULTISPECIES: histidine phosphatase family protein [unclassified Selenomonas]MBQ1868348.1 histidine phosphatase family protein [Selenomonas sp.]TYZ21659.1 histidine phosphatase family protein [Selenomonas sp. mPRGC5]